MIQKSIIEPILHPMDASNETRFMFIDLNQLNQLVLHPMDASMLLDSRSYDLKSIETASFTSHGC